MNHDLINLQRLTARLEGRTEPFADSIEYLAFQATHKHALDLLHKVQTQNVGSSRNAKSMDGLASRLSAVQARIDAQKETVQPHFAKKPRRPSFLKPQPPAAPEEEPPLQVDPLPSDLEPPKRRSLQLNLDPLPPPDEPLLKQRRSTDGSTKDISNLLDHHRSLQDALTADLTGMATQLKLNSLHFQDSLRKDRALVEGVENSMEGNLGTMQGQSGRLSAVRKKGRWTTCYVVGAVATVAAAWFFMFALMRIT